MKKSAAVITAFAAFGFVKAASAADMPVKAVSAPVAAPAYNWSGWYLGGNAGYGSSRDNVGFAADPATFGPGIAGGFVAPSLSPRAKGGLGGVQIGYNYQMGAAVFGVEADYDFASIRGTDTFRSGDLFGTYSNTAERKITSLGTLRARAGFLLTSSLLLYATGGLAWGNTSLNITSINNFTCAAFPGCLSATDSGAKAGWALGAGGEWMFAPNWSVKAEYLYVDLGSRSATVSARVGSPPINNFYTGTTKFRENIVRGGVNYHF